MSKHKTVICFFSIITFAVICITNLAAQENKSVQDTIMDFYKTKEYETAPELLEAFFNEGDTLDEDASWYYPAVFFFSKIFPSENALNRLMSIYDKTDNEKKRFLILVIGLKDKQLLKKIYEKENDAFLKGFIAAVINDETGYDPLKSNITNATELDVLWSVFFATGETAPIRKIASVLAWEDIFKNKIEEFEGDTKQKQELKNILSDFDIEYKNGEPAALTVGCDISVLEKYEERPKSFRKLLQILQIPEDELYRASIKYAAFWSLAANLNRHLPVRTVCLHIAADETAPERNIMLFVLVKSVKY